MRLSRPGLISGGSSFDRVSDNQDLRLMLPPIGDSSSCDRPDAAKGVLPPYGERWRPCLQLAKDNLRRFDIILILDHYAQTLRLMCATLSWSTCQDMNQKKQKRRYSERSEDIYKHVRDSWPRNSSSLPHPERFISVGTALDRNAPGIDLFNYAMELSSEQLRAHGLEPGFSAHSRQRRRRRH